jgi:hypothetical protein
MQSIARLSTVAGAAAVALALAPLCAGTPMGKAGVAALQTALIARQLYLGPVDGLADRETTDAIRAFQRDIGLKPSGSLGTGTRRALGTWARYELGDRSLGLGMKGWDVAELQFQLAWHGFPSSFFTGAFTDHVRAALIRFQRWAHLVPDGISGPATLKALRSPVPTCPIHLGWPVRAPVSSPFGPRGFGFHSGIDLAATTGTPVFAATAGRVSWAGFLPGGWGNLVVVNGPRATQTMYAHLSVIDSTVGEQVSAGRQIGRVGATGDARGAHLHFEVRVRGASVDPLPGLR